MQDEWRKVVVSHGLGVRSIDSVLDARIFLDEVPAHRRGPIYHTAFNACSRALLGEFAKDAARSAFVGWAKSASILMPEPPMATMSLKRPGGGFRP